MRINRSRFIAKHRTRIILITIKGVHDDNSILPFLHSSRPRTVLACKETYSRWPISHRAAAALAHSGFVHCAAVDGGDLDMDGRGAQRSGRAARRQLPSIVRSEPRRMAVAGCGSDPAWLSDFRK